MAVPSSSPCCSLARAGLSCRGVSCLPSYCMPCWHVWPDDIYSWWAWWPGCFLSLVRAQLLFLLTWFNLCFPQFYNLPEMSWDSHSGTQGHFVLLMIPSSSLILLLAHLYILSQALFQATEEPRLLRKAQLRLSFCPPT